MARRSWLEKVTLRRVVVHMDSGRSIEGCLAETSWDGLVLRSAVLLGEPALSEKDTALEGDVFVPRANVVFVQEAR